MSPSLYQLAGLERPPHATFGPSGTVDVDPAEEWEELVGEASLMLRAGVVLTPEWWARQTLVERLALVHAGDRIAAQRAAAAGTATQGPRGAAAVLSGSDGGAALLRIELQEAAGRIAAEAVRR